MIEHEHQEIPVEKIESIAELTPELALGVEIITRLKNEGFEAYVAGGFCRDLLLGKIPKDVDIATSAQPEELLVLTLPDVEFELIAAAEAYPVVQARRGYERLEIATFRQDIYLEKNDTSRRPAEMILGATLAEDANRRDLTINALYFDPLTNTVIDPTGHGINDVEQRLIRFVGDPHQRILEDRIRLLRAIRFKNRFDFQYDETTQAALRQDCREVLNIRAIDRILQELTRMLTLPSRSEALRDLDELGLLELILPEFTAGKGIAQPPEFHTEGDVFAHQLLVMEHLPERPSEVLVWSALLHDIGKPETFSQAAGERIRFDGHDRFGAERARMVMQRLGASNDQTAEIEWLVRQHMVVRQLPQMKRSTQLRLVQPHLFDNTLKNKDLFLDLLALVRADNAASLRPNGLTDQEGIDELEQIGVTLREETANQRPSVKERFGIDGFLLMKKFGLQQKDPKMRLLGTVIGKLDEVFQNNPHLTKEEILETANQLWTA